MRAGRGRRGEPDPYDVYRRLRGGAPVYEVGDRDEGGGAEFVVTRHRDVEAVLRDERFSANRLRASRFRAQADALPADLRPDQQSPTLLNVDPPDHTRLRRLVSRAFTPRRVEALAPAIERRAAQLLDDVDARHPIDVVAAYAAPLPARVIADLLGVPEADQERFRGWSDAMLRTLVGATPDLAAFREARDALEHYLGSVAEARRREPQGDLISALVEAREDDALGDDELLATCVLLLVAGHETTTNLIANGAFLLLSEAGAGGASAFLAAPEPAIEELLRFESPIQGIARATTETLELGGATLPAGSLVSAMIGAANRDPEQFERPDTLDLGRDPNPHLAFGKGVHFCLGAALARLEARIALGALFERWPALALLDEEPAWRRSLLLRGLEHLWVRERC